MHLSDPISGTATAVVGLALIFAGRRIFWLFVGGIGFLAGLYLAPFFAGQQPGWVFLLVGCALGLIGALLAVFLERIAVAVAGWLAGGMLGYRLALELGWSNPMGIGIAFLVGAIVVAIVASQIFDWALIFVTAITGALMVCDAVQFSTTTEWWIAALLIVAGVFFQARSLTGATTG